MSYFSLQSRKYTRIIDLDQQRRLGTLAQTEYKRLATLHSLNKIGYEWEKSSRHDICPSDRNEITSMEIDPKESKYLLTLSRNSTVAIFNVHSNATIYDTIMKIPIPPDEVRTLTPPNSIHWFWDCSMFSVGTRTSIQFWDASIGNIIEVIQINSKVINHVTTTKNHSSHDYVAVSGKEGNVFIIDLRVGNVVMTSQAVEQKPIRALHWHPSNELIYATGNENGNIFLWDIRFQKEILLKFCSDQSFSQVPSHQQPVAGLRFYNNGVSIISIDNKGTIKSWEVSSGQIRYGYYDKVIFCELNQNTFYKEYQFATTENLKEDIAFMPSNHGLIIFDINSGLQLPNSKDIHRNVICTSYDSQKICVYGSLDDVVRSWAPLPPPIDELTIQ
ncbi:DNA excision repair protein ERCC-8-like [Daktulosphaira vitifoliae]|uniref:DNA excision repair protein ERCC-8-like n=1 Tax=Daktulosphaira vitifoliae TaxID=58002 RepID=UPI0021AA62B3|nr:DNA excision repair protein ERCC-8-like [Daktulosphaira vitifoliae]XP_050530925.1 DNA excision repair protein ERCC-8-like [Daktulosphaira vitifoliae]